MADQTQRLEIATVKAEVGSNILYRFSNDEEAASAIPTDSGDIQNLKQVVAGIQADATDKISVATTIYQTAAAGLAASTVGGIFLVQSTDADEIYTVWQNVSGAAVNTGKTAMSSQAVQDALTASNQAAQAAEDAADVATNRTAGFLSPAAVAPVVRDDGLPLQVGDRYFNTEQQAEYLYTSAGWEANESQTAIVELKTALSESDTTEQGAGLIGVSDDLAYPVGSAGARINYARKGVDALGKKRDLAYRKSVGLVLPLRFPDYAAAFAAVGNPTEGYIYPQGHCYDSAGNIFIKYNNGTYSIVVWHTANGVYGGWFLIQSGGESIVVLNKGLSRFIYNKGGTDSLYVYDITSMPSNGVVVPYSDVGISGVGLQYAHANGKWIVEQASVDVGGQGSRTKWNIYDDAFAKQGDFYVAKDVVGWQLTTSAHYKYVPKSQGVALRGDKVIFGVGGSYIPANDGAVSPKASSIGVAECNLDGSVSTYGTLRADALIPALTAKGYACDRTESEGVTVRPDGSLSHILITLRPASSEAATGGILLLNEMDVEGDDYSALAEQYAPFNLARTYSGNFPRSPDGGIYNPFSGVKFTTMDQIIQYMGEVQVPRFAWFTSAVTVTPIDGITLPSAASVEILTQNLTTYLVNVIPSGGDRVTYAVNNTLGTSVYVVAKSGVDAKSLRIVDLDASLNVSAKLRTAHKTATDTDILFANQQSTSGGNLLSLGGGNSSYYAVSRIWQYVGDSLTTKGGTVVTETFTSGFNPGADGGFSLGLSTKRWSVLYASTSTIATSDANSKQQVKPIDDACMDAWATVDHQQYKLNDAVQLKGDAARWHVGLIAQKVLEAFQAKGLDAFEYGLLCYDKWEATEAILDEEGGEIYPAQEAGERYGIRYEEALTLEAALSRRTATRMAADFDAKIKALETRLFNLENAGAKE